MPKINRVRLTRSMCHKWLPPQTKSDACRWDSEVVGLGIRVRPAKGTGNYRSRSFVYHGTLRAPHPQAGDYIRFSLGPVGKMDLEEARSEAAKCNSILRAGGDPRLRNQAPAMDPAALSLATVPVTHQAPAASDPPASPTTVKDLAVKMMTDHYGTTWEKQPRSQTDETPHARTQRQFWKTYILPIIGDMPLNEVETTDIERVTKEAAKVSNTTANHIRTCLKTAFNRAQVWKLHTGVNPVKDSKVYPVRKRPHILKEDELLNIISEGEKLLLATIQGKHPTFRLNQIFQIIAILLGPETVRRPSELFRMEWDWIDFKHRVVYLDRAKGDRSNSKEHRGQTFTFSKRGQHLLEIAKHFSGDSKYVFPSTKSNTGHIKTVRTMWQTLKKLAGVTRPASAYTYKHAVVSLSPDAGVALLSIQEACGHAKAETTQIYYRSNDARRTSTSDKLSNYMDAQREPEVELSAIQSAAEMSDPDTR